MTGKEFEDELRRLNLMPRRLAAAKLKVNESTITRAIKGKPSRFLLMLLDKAKEK